MHRRDFHSLVVGAGMGLLGSVSANAAADPDRPAGTLLKATPIETKLKGASAWKVRYLSKDIHDVPHEVTGLVMAPSAKGKDRPIVTWTHGTTGLGDAACPSAQPDPARELTAYFDGGSSQQIDYGVPGVQGMIDRGYVVCATDYQGLGTSEVHQYMVSTTNARDGLFLAHAARQLDVGAGLRVVGYGWSQGGAAAASLAELPDADFGPLELRGTVALSPAIASFALLNPTGMAAALVDTKRAPDSHLLMVLWGFAAGYPRLDPADVFTPLGLKLMQESWQVQPVHHLDGTISRNFRLKGAILQTPPRNFEAWKQAILESSAGRLKPRCPVLMCVDAFEGGTVVPVPWQHDYAKAVQALGGQIETQNFPDDDHFSLPFSAQKLVAGWMEKVLDSRP